MDQLRATMVLPTHWHAPRRAAIRGIAAALPPRRVTSAEVEARIRAASPRCPVPDGMIALVAGVQERRYADDCVYPSDLAAEAATRVLAETGTDPADVDLLIFASASQDLAEPATANIVQERVGTHAAVFDIKNACNSFLDAVRVAEAFIVAGTYRTVLVATGETPSRCIKWDAATRDELQRNFPGYTLGDAGAAALLAPATDGRGIFYGEYRTISRHWRAATILGGGSRHPRGDEYSYIQGDGAALKNAFVAIGPEILQRALAATETTFDDYAAIFVHQVTLPYHKVFCRVSGIPEEKIPLTVPHLGNMAAASLPVALAQARQEGRVGAGDRVMLVGMAAGISVGVMMATL
jgi:3-oxoacyl-[acyl-carrier-protein] synthase III